MALPAAPKLRVPATSCKPAANVLIDCGLFQGARKTENYNRVPKVGSLEKLDAVVLTHAHLDHTGRLPLLTCMSYRGPIYATPATIEIAELILKDSAHLQQGDVERQNRRRQRQGLPLLDPLYVATDVDQLKPLYKPLRHDHPTPVALGVTVRGVEAGHVRLREHRDDGGAGRSAEGRGFLRRSRAARALHRDPVPFQRRRGLHGIDLRRPRPQITQKPHRDAVVKKAVAAGSGFSSRALPWAARNCCCTSWRARFQRETLKPFPIYIDSPMAIQATKIYGKHAELYDDEALAMQKSGELRQHLQAQFSSTADDSPPLNDVPGPCLIMAGAVCARAGILHHLRHNLANPRTTVIFPAIRGTVRWVD